MSFQARVAMVAALITSFAFVGIQSTSAEPTANEAFQRTWARTDKPVADLIVSRTWMWGPEAFTGPKQEAYAEGTSGQRTVQYFDKSRMEINHDSSIPTDSIWHVTNGLLVRELMTGQMQVGDAAFQTREAARINVAGDPDDASGVTYWFMGLLQGEAPLTEGTIIKEILTPGAAGRLYMWSDDMAAYAITAARFVPETNHSIATPFWEFMTASGTVHENGNTFDARLFEDPFYATGFPVTEAYWARVKLAGISQDVLIQCFERRCLTYTPSNDPAWRVEAGNVGQHYYRWRYNETPNPPDQPDPPDQPASDYQWSLTWEAPWDAGMMDTDDTGRVYVVSSAYAEDVNVYSPSGEFLFKLDDEVLEGDEWWEVGFSQATDVAVIGDPNNGAIFVLARLGSQDGVFVFDMNGQFVGGWYVSQDFRETGGFASSIDVDPFGYVTVTGQGKVVWYLYTGEYYGEVELPIGWVSNVEVDRESGTTYVVNSDTDQIFVVDFDGNVIDIWSGFRDPISVSSDTSGALFVAEFGGNQITKLSPSGQVLLSFGSAGEGNGQFASPWGIAVDRSGNVYVSDAGTKRVQKFVQSR